MSQPFGKCKLLKLAALKHLQKFEVGIAGILDVVRQSLHNISDVSGFEIQSTSPAAGGKHRHPPLTGHVVLPFIGVWVPVQLPQPARVNGHNRRRNCGRNLERAGIDNPYLTAFHPPCNRGLVGTKREIILRDAERPGRLGEAIEYGPGRADRVSTGNIADLIRKYLGGAGRVTGEKAEQADDLASVHVRPEQESDDPRQNVPEAVVISRSKKKIIGEQG